MRIGAVALALLVGSGCGGSGGDDAGWPSVEVESLDDGRDVSTGDLVGDQPLVVSLWAVWCQPCRRELPDLQELAEARAGEIDVVGVNIGDDADQVRSFLGELGVDFPIYRDLDGLLLTALEVPQVPATAIVLPGGELEWLHLGEVTREQVESEVAAALERSSGNDSETGAGT